MTREAFEDAVVSLLGVLHSVSYSLLPNPEDQADAVQECVRKALQKRETLREDRFLKTWLIRILVNECYTILRGKKRIFSTDSVEIVAPPQADGTVFEALMQLEEKYRLPIVLHHIEGYKTQEIARILRIPEGTVKGRLARGRTRLQAILVEQEAWP